jgi:hypothetical protein
VTILNECVTGLQITVQDVAAVDVNQRLNHLQEQPQAFFERLVDPRPDDGLRRVKQ